MFGVLLRLRTAIEGKLEREAGADHIDHIIAKIEDGDFKNSGGERDLKKKDLSPAF